MSVKLCLRFVDDQSQIQQHAVCVMLLAKSLTGEEEAHQLIVCLSTELSQSFWLLQCEIVPQSKASQCVA